MKNELIIAEYKNLPGEHARKRMEAIMAEFDLSEMKQRFMQDRS